MDYTTHYNKLIERARSRVLEGYTEKHHIIPRCMGGSDDPSNIVELTPEEHYVAHQLLVKVYPGEAGLVYAAQMMGATRKGNKSYGWLRRKLSEAMTGVPKTEAAKLKMSLAKKGKPSPKKGIKTGLVTSGSWKKGNTPWNADGTPAYTKAIEIDGIVYESRLVAAKDLNKDITTIMRWLKKGKATCRGIV